ncbi:MAG: hypothetical protein IKP84_05900 [Prevotella sp.]|nr:hypothetical protein [Prevotella sp.]
MKTFLISLISMCCIAAHAQFSDVKQGDIIDINGTKGLVFQVDESGCHGKAMSIQCLRGVKNSWCNDKKLGEQLPSMSDENDGFANTKALLDFARANGKLSSFPVFEWCTKLGEGWYVPSVKELEAFVNYWLGNEQTLDWDDEEETENSLNDDNKTHYRQINDKLLEAGGIPVLNGVFTSTVTPDGKVYTFHFNRANAVWSFGKRTKEKLNVYYVGRAFYNF